MISLYKSLYHTLPYTKSYVGIHSKMSEKYLHTKTLLTMLVCKNMDKSKKSLKLLALSALSNIKVVAITVSMTHLDAVIMEL